MKCLAGVAGIVLALLCTVESGMAAAMKTIHVPEDYPTIQQAIHASTDGDTILVADGTWTGEGNTGLNLQGKIITLQSVSGDPMRCVIFGDNSAKGVFITRGETRDTVIKGFTFDSCTRDPASTGLPDGGAILIEDASPSIIRCRFVNCSAEVYSPDPWGIELGPYGLGGAIAVQGYAFPQIIDCVFENNFSGEDGGALSIRAEKSARANNRVHISGCTFHGNRTFGQGGAIYLEEIPADILRCDFVDNRALYGGAIACFYSDSIIGGDYAGSNFFGQNKAAIGADLYASGTSGMIDARFNRFASIPISDYSVRPQTSFRLTGFQLMSPVILTDVYVAPDGDDRNDGLTPETPFRTVYHAMSRLLPADTRPLTIHLAKGLYSADITGEHFPLPLLSNITIRGVSPYETTLCGSQKNTVFYGSMSTGIALRQLTIQNGAGKYGGGIFAELCGLELTDVTVQNCMGKYAGGIGLNVSTTYMERTHVTDNAVSYRGNCPGIYSCGGRLVMKDCLIARNGTEVENIYLAVNGAGLNVVGKALLVGCIIENNGQSINTYGGGIAIWNGPVQLVDCIIRNNRSFYGGGIHALGKFDLLNCLVTDNMATYQSAGLYADNSTGTIRHTTFAGGTGGDESEVATVAIRKSTFDISDSIFWNQTDREFTISTNSDVSVSYCAVRDGFTGQGNIAENPRFFKAPMSDYYLDDGSNGRERSPCINAGSCAAADCSYEGDWGVMALAERTAQSGWKPDTGFVDMGYHWNHSMVNGIKLDLSQRVFYPGDIFYLNAIVLNNSGSTWFNSKVFILLEISGQFWFAPSFVHADTGMDYYSMHVPGNHFARVIEVIPPFAWPSLDHDSEILFFYGAVTDSAIRTLLGDLDVFAFEYRTPGK